MNKKYLEKATPGMVTRLSLLCAIAVMALPSNASAKVEHVVLDVEDTFGIPAVQALIIACLLEPVSFTGTVRITLVDGVPTHFNWSAVTGMTADGDLFVGGSGVAVGKQSNLTLAEVGAGADARQLHLQIVDGEISVVCHL